MSTFLNQLRAGLGSLLNKDVGELSEAELAQLVSDEAEKVTKVTDEVIEVSPAKETPTSNAVVAEASENSAIDSRIANAEATIESLQVLVNAQTEAVNAQVSVIKDLTGKVETLKSLTTVLTNKVVALNVGSVTSVSESKDPITSAVNKAEKDDQVVTMNMADFLGISNQKKQ